MKVKRVNQLLENNAEELAQEYDFTYDYEYYDYIIDSYINGQKQQMFNLFNNLDNESKKAFFEYLDNTTYNDSNDIKKLLIDYLIDND